MKKFHFSRGVFYRFRLSVIISVLFVGVQIVALQHFYFLNNVASANEIDTPYLQKLKLEREQVHERSARLLFMGDTMLARSIGTSIENGINPYEFVLEQLNSHDLRIANIETTVADESFVSAATKPYTFNAPLSSLQILKNVHIDLSSLANNHTGDFGRLATKNMLEQFESNELLTVGAGTSISDAFKPVFIEHDGIRLAFIAVNDIELVHTKVSDSQVGSAFLDKDLIASSIQSAKQAGADAVFVLPHWGVEYSTTQSKRQVEWGRFMIDAGATAVIGGHPHVVQPTEEYNGGYIVYSLGNFIFDGMEGEALRGQMISLEIQKSTNYKSTTTKVKSLQSVGTLIDNNGFPRLM